MNTEKYEPFINLANAIVIQAAKDYRRTLRRLKCNPKNIDAQIDKYALEKFFRSEWYGLLTDVSADYVLKMIARANI